MNGIRWIKSHSYKEVPEYNAKIGCISLCCRPSIREYFGNFKARILGWTCTIYFCDRQIGHTIRKKSLEFVQKEAEKSAIKYLLGNGFITMKALKKVGLAEELLSEVGIDL